MVLVTLRVVVLNDLIPAYILNVTYGAVSSSHPVHDVPSGTTVEFVR